MRKKLLLSFAIVLPVFLMFGFMNNEASSNSAGPPGGYSGSPGDAQNCTACHSANVNNVSGWITSDIPASGYSAGVVYNITATAIESGASSFGFQISPQLTSGNPVGQMIGSLIVTNTTETKLSSTPSTNDNKYITHRAAGTSGSNTRTWTFKWQAPSTNLKSVTFYGAFKTVMASKSNNVYLSSYTKAPNLSGLNDEAFANAINLSVFPNPVSSELTISVDQEKPTNVTVQILDLQGKLLQNLCENENIVGTFSKTFELTDLENGTYFLAIKTSENSCVRKIVVVK